MTTITISVDWPAIHAACEALDVARNSCAGRLAIGFDGTYDAFGGTYSGDHFERRALAGLYAIRHALESITDAAWTIVHQASSRARDAGRTRAEDGWYEVRVDADDDDEPVMVRKFSHRRKHAAAAKRVAEEIAYAQAAVRVALAARQLYDLLMATGIAAKDPSSSIAAGYGDAINLTGLRWLAGQREEREPVTVAQAQAFAAGGLDALRAALAGNGE